MKRSGESLERRLENGAGQDPVRLSLYLDDADVAANLLMKYHENLIPAGKRGAPTGAAAGFADDIQRLVGNERGHIAVGGNPPPGVEAAGAARPPQSAPLTEKAAPRAPPADAVMMDGLGFKDGRPLPAAQVQILPTRPNQFLNPQDTPQPNVQARALTHKPSWMSDRTIAPTTGKTTTLIGSYKNDMASVLGEMNYPQSLDFGPKDGGFNILNVPKDKFNAGTFWQEYNEPWLRQATNRGDDILVLSNPRDPSLLTRGGEATNFSKEVNFMENQVRLGRYRFVAEEGKYVPTR